MSTETSRAAPQHPSAVRCKESDNTPAASTPTITGCCAHSCRAQPGNPQSHLCPMTRHARGCTLLRNPGRGRRDLPHTCTVPAATLACFALRERTTHIHNQGGFPLCICCFPGWAEKGWVGGQLYVISTSLDTGKNGAKGWEARTRRRGSQSRHVCWVGGPRGTPRPLAP